MNSTIYLTNVKNIDFKQMRVIDDSLVTKETHDSDLKIHVFKDTLTGIERRDSLIHVSLFDDVIVRGTEEYKILNMLSKNYKSND